MSNDDREGVNIMQVRLKVNSLGGRIEHLIDYQKLIHLLGQLEGSINGNGELIIPNDDGLTETVIKSRSIKSFEITLK